MAFKDILNLVTQVTPANAARPAKIAGPNEISQSVDKLVEQSHETGFFRLDPDQIKQLGATAVTADPDRTKVLMAAGAFLNAVPDFTKRYGYDPNQPEELIETEHGVQRVQGAFQSWTRAAQNGVLLLGADLTTRVEKVDDALTQMQAEGKLPVALLLLPEKLERAKGADAAQARADRTRARHALTQGQMDAEARQSMLARATDRLGHLPELPAAPRSEE